MKTLIVLILLTIVAPSTFAQSDVPATCILVKFIRKSAGAAAFLKNCVGSIPKKVAVTGIAAFPGDIDGLTHLFAATSPGDKVTLITFATNSPYGGTGHFASLVNTSAGSFRPYQAYVLSWESALINIGK